MPGHLFVSFDLYHPGRGTMAIEAVIRQLGPATRVHMSLWYVRTTLSVGEACAVIAHGLGQRDRLVVIDVARNTAAWRNLTPALSALLQETWHAP